MPINKVIVIGNLGANTEIRTFPSRGRTWRISKPRLFAYDHFRDHR